MPLGVNISQIQPSLIEIYNFVLKIFSNCWNYFCFGGVENCAIRYGFSILRIQKGEQFSNWKKMQNL